MKAVVFAIFAHAFLFSSCVAPRFYLFEVERNFEFNYSYGYDERIYINNATSEPVECICTFKKGGETRVFSQRFYSGNRTLVQTAAWGGRLVGVKVVSEKDPFFVICFDSNNFKIVTESEYERYLEMEREKAEKARLEAEAEQERQRLAKIESDRRRLEEAKANGHDFGTIEELERWEEAERERRRAPAYGVGLKYRICDSDSYFLYGQVRLLYYAVNNNDSYFIMTREGNEYLRSQGFYGGLSGAVDFIHAQTDALYADFKAGRRSFTVTQNSLLSTEYRCLDINSVDWNNERDVSLLKECFRQYERDLAERMYSFGYLKKFYYMDFYGVLK